MSAPAALTNRLAEAQSPYLQQHRANPVHWQPWDDATFALARALGRPVLLSIGYSSCHWCHVMAHESFEDDATAAVMNALFVNIKVDREERPDLDRLFLSALARLGKQAGWPATVFLTPAGEPFAGGGYFPKQPAFGLPAFCAVLEQVAAQYHADPPAAVREGRGLIQAITRRYRRSAAGAVSRALLDHVAHDLARSVDWLYGGFGQSGPKFLQPGGHEVLLRAWARLDESGLLDTAAMSVASICNGGVYDHLGGGFHRYATDDRWQAPHFEKMLHDNALMVSLLTRLWQAAGHAVFADRVAQTIGWMLREMRLPGGAFAASLDADLPGGGEGAYYTWDAAELRLALADDAAAFFARYAAPVDGPFAGRAVLVRTEHDPLAATPCPIRPVLARLAAQRDGRGRPARDDKALADWNGLAVAALAEAGIAFERPDWIAAAAAAFDAVRALLAGPDGLSHSSIDGRRTSMAFADDYACLAQGALALFEATADFGYVAHARAWVGVLDAQYWDDVDGGYYFTAAGIDDAPRQKLIDETNMPAANGAMLGVLARLGALTGDERYLRQAEGIIRCFADRLSRGSIAVATALNNSQAPERLVQVVVVGDPASAASQALRRAAAGCFVADRLLVAVAPDAVLPPGHPAHGKTMVAGEAAAYVCVGRQCLPPVTTPELLCEALVGARG